MITIIDYGVGNVKSVSKAFEYLKYPAQISNDAQEIAKADILVLPGVGAFAAGINNLKQSGLIPYIKEHILQYKPFLGFCLGFQLLFEASEENGFYEGLGIFKGIVKNFQGVIDPSLKIPHMGWNTLQVAHDPNNLLDRKTNPFFYFVHSYYVETEDPDIVFTKTNYGIDFVSAIQTKNVLATQFHPEKSGQNGLKLLENFLTATTIN